VINEILEGRWFAIFFTHKKQGREGGKNDAGSSEFALFEVA
jgi:hypothetical protein